MQEGQDQNQAGWVFSPDGSSTPPTPPAPPAAPAPPAPPQDQPQAHPDSLPRPQADSQPNPYQANPGHAAQPQPDPGQDEQDVTPDTSFAVKWSASEFIAHHKSSSWFMKLGIAAAAVGVAIYFITQDIFSIVIVAILAIAFGVIGARQPNTREYAIGEHGVMIGPKFYPYVLFKSFSVLDDDAVSFISLLPNKRFMPPLAMYYPPDQENKIVDTLGDFLPYEEKSHDLMDRLSRKYGSKRSPELAN